MPYLAKHGQIGKNHTKEQISELSNDNSEQVLTRQDIAEATGKSLPTVDREIARQRNPESEVEEDNEPDIPVVEETISDKALAYIKKLDPPLNDTILDRKGSELSIGAYISESRFFNLRLANCTY